MDVSVAIITLNEEANLARTLVALLPRTPVSFRYEILVIDNGSTDGTYAAFRAVQAEFPDHEFRWFRQWENNLGRARSRALREAKFPFVAFTDADCVVPPRWMQTLVTEFTERRKREPLLLGLGGGNEVPAEASTFHHALSLALSSWWGNMHSPQAKTFGEEKWVSHLPTCNVIYDRERALGLGGFSSRFPLVCEDLEFSRRATKKGYKLIFIPQLAVTHFHRPDAEAWAQKMFRYGWGQVAVAREHPLHLLGVRALPFLAIFLFTATLLYWPLCAALLGFTYLTWMSTWSSWLARKKISLAPSVFFLLVTTHLSYGLGECWGLVHWAKNNKGK